jgi:hypothetical protein
LNALVNAFDKLHMVRDANPGYSGSKYILRTGMVFNDPRTRSLIRCASLRPDHALRSKETPCLAYCEAIYACVAGFTLKMRLKLSRYCRKTRIHNTQATSAGAMLPGAIVR